jgi:hypothetical protein
MVFNQIVNSGARVGDVSTSCGGVGLRQWGKGIENRGHLAGIFPYGTNREAYCFVCRSSLLLIRHLRGITAYSLTRNTTITVNMADDQAHQEASSTSEVTMYQTSLCAHS